VHSQNTAELHFNRLPSLLSQVLEELKAQGFLAAGGIFQAIRSATRATELEPGWADGWVTLGRAQARVWSVLPS
jgi:hypothetical protein